MFRLSTALLLVLIGAPASAIEVRDDFQATAHQYELVGPAIWKFGGGAARFQSKAYESFAVATCDTLEQATITTQLRIDGRHGTGYSTAGLSLFEDQANHWRLLLVCGPTGNAYFELVEKYRGVHQAQRNAAGGTGLASKDEGKLTTWQFNRDYQLTLTLAPGSLSGEIRDPATGSFWRRTFALEKGKAIAFGRPALTAGEMSGSYGTLSIEGQAEIGKRALAVTRGPAGAIALVEDEQNRHAPAWKQWFEAAGFGVVSVAWPQLEETRFTSDIDLVVLTDATRLPAAGMHACTRYLRSRGKLLALGAPAFGHPLVKSPQGYVAPDKLAETLYNRLERHPIALDARQWHFGAMNRESRGSVVAEDAAATTWRMQIDYRGWGTFAQSIRGALSQQRPLLVFEARGEASVPQISVECVETDGARWIATVPLTTTWKKVVLRPADFAYWKDSKAARGALGDAFQPAQADLLRIGFSTSHTPQTKAGTRQFWVRHLAAATGGEWAIDDPTSPRIEAMSPSYMLYPLTGVARLQSAHPTLQNASENAVVPFSAPAYSAVWRENGIGFDRQRPWRWIRLVDAFDAEGNNRGPLAWLMLGNTTHPGALWANIGVAQSAVLGCGNPTAQTLRKAIIETARRMTRGQFLMEAGTDQFGYYRNEPVRLGASVLNAGRERLQAKLRFVVTGGGRTLLEQERPVTALAGVGATTSFDWPQPDGGLPDDCRVRVELADEAGTIDAIEHAFGNLPEGAADPGEFVTIDGSNFRQHGKPWYMLGMNYRPNSQGGRQTTAMLDRAFYDPEAIERDLAWMESAGINMLSAIQQPTPPEENPKAYRDLHDFLNRCRKHHMKVFYFLRVGNPLAGGTAEAVKKHIAAAGIQHHPAILAWELSWEPIYYRGPADGRMAFLQPDWNRWIVDRYGSLELAERDWGFALTHLPVGKTKAKTPPAPQAALPDAKWLEQHGPWDKAAAAFRRFFSDRVGQAYGEMIAEIRQFDPNHLVTFRFGACGIPDRSRFAHAHSAAVAKHVSFLCPEGYNLQPEGPAKPTGDDDIRKGGLVTLYYRFLSREKPVVWMEFGYSVMGMHTIWQTGMEHIPPAQLATQQSEFKKFYSMMLESGARGAAPWWLPGGFRLGEESDFGVLEPDGRQRPCCDVLRSVLPMFAQLDAKSCIAAANESGPVIELDFDAHYADAWETYGQQYLQAVAQGKLPKLRTAGTGSTSADCPLLAVGNRPCNGANPPKFLNAEIGVVEVREGKSAWRRLPRDSAIVARAGEPLRMRLELGNTEEATWLAPAAQGPGEQTGRVYVQCTIAGQRILVPLLADTPYLDDGDSAEFELPGLAPGRHMLALQAVVSRADSRGRLLRIPFGEKRQIAVTLSE